MEEKKQEEVNNKQPSAEERLNALEQLVDELKFREALMAKHKHTQSGEVVVPY